MGIQIGLDRCPCCQAASRLTLATLPYANYLTERDKAVFCYLCDACLEPIGVLWSITDWHSQNNPIVSEARLISPALENFNFTHVPLEVQRDIAEALDCLSVRAYNGFAAVCRRAVQTLCSDLGADSSTRVQQQINEMMDMTGLGEEWRELARQVMLTGHDGAHPQLPEVDAERAALLLQLIQDLTYQLYTRPGNIREAARRRTEAS